MKLSRRRVAAGGVLGDSAQGEGYLSAEMSALTSHEDGVPSTDTRLISMHSCKSLIETSAGEL